MKPEAVVFPLFVTSVVFDLGYLANGSSALPVISFWEIAAGIVVGLLAVLSGLWHWLAIDPSAHAKRVGAIHGVLSVVVVSAFAGSWMLRAEVPGYAPSGAAVALALVGAVMALVSGRLDAELVERHAVPVRERRVRERRIRRP
jgi:uncharacterized membrane protein